jgi:pilus assembly protein CpaE
MRQKYSDTLRALLVSASETTRDNLTNSLEQLGVAHTLFWVAQPDLTLTRAQDVFPHIIFVDDALNGSSVERLVEQLVSHIPDAAVLVLVDAQNMAAARTAVLVGARGFLLKPLRVDELSSTLQQVMKRPAVASSGVADTYPEEGQIIVFCAPKGGTGRTTLALNTAISLYQLTGDSVVLVDADFAAPALDVALNLQHERDITALLPRLSQLDEEVIDNVLADHVSGVRVLLAPPPEALESPISLPQVQMVLAKLKKMFTWVIVDLGLPMDETAFAFLDGADRIVLNVLPEMIGLRNTRLMLNQMITRGYAAERIWVVLNRVTIKGGISPADIERRLQIQIADRIPDDQALVTYSVNRGVPLVLSHRNSALARAFRDFATHILAEMGHNKAVLDEAEDAGFFQRLLRKRSQRLSL